MATAQACPSLLAMLEFLSWQLSLSAQQAGTAARSARLGEGRDSHVLMVQDCTLSFSV